MNLGLISALISMAAAFGPNTNLALRNFLATRYRMKKPKASPIRRVGNLKGYYARRRQRFFGDDSVAKMDALNRMVNNFSH